MQNNNFEKRRTSFYKDSLQTFIKSNIPFMVGGGFALAEHTGVIREAKDLDIFCKASDYPRFIRLLSDKGFKTEITDARWIAKVQKGEYLVDLIFSTPGGTWVIDDTWFKYAIPAKIFDLNVKVLGLEDLIWSKAYIQDRYHYDGADIHHLFLKKGRNINWQRLLRRMEAHWEILLSHIINFRFIYPSERSIIPKWLIEELILRVQEQFIVPKPQDKICRGTLLSRSQYKIDINDWGFKDVT